MNVIERHHTVPLSLWGLDVPANIVELPKHTHRHVHDTLNIRGNEYSSIMRRYRKLFNGRHEVQEDEVNYRLNVQSLYFSRYKDLAPLAKEAHIECFNRLIWHLEDCLSVWPSFEGSNDFRKLWNEYANAYTNYFLID